MNQTNPETKKRGGHQSDEKKKQSGELSRAEKISRILDLLEKLGIIPPET